MEISKAKVLIVDDEVDLADLVSESFQIENLNADMAHSGMEALERCQKEQYHIILSDNHMPGMEGTEFFEKLKDLYSHKYLFYLCTGDVGADKRDFIASGGADIITKPYDVFVLIDKIKKDLESI